MSVPNDHPSDENKKGKSAIGKQNQDDMISQILEHGDIFFFYRPKVAAREVTGIDDIRRFFSYCHRYQAGPIREQRERRELELRIKHRIYTEDRTRWSNEGHYSFYMI
jgi:hypothetical protein